MIIEISQERFQQQVVAFINAQSPSALSDLSALFIHPFEYHLFSGW